MDIKKQNRIRIYNLIYKRHKISRQEIADELQLSLPTVNQNLKELLSEGYIEADGNYNSTGGRKAQIFTACADQRLAVSVNIEPTYIKIAFINLFGEILTEERVDARCNNDLNLGSIIENAIEDIIKKKKISKKKILGVGITIPGILDEKAKMILMAPTLSLKDYPVSRITQEISYDCVIMNDARAGAMADYWFGKSDYDKVYLMLNYGVGGAFINVDEIKKGINNRSGEFGHMTLYPGGRKCTCGREGCLEAYVSSRRLAEDSNTDLDTFFIELEKGNKDYKKIFKQYLDDLTTGINNLYIMVDERVVLGGPIAYYLKKYLNEINHILSEKYSFSMENPYIRTAECSNEQADLGAALMIISDFIKSI